MSKITPRIPNSPPPSGRNTRMPDAPTSGRPLVRKSEPHAAHPIPSTPLAKPIKPVATPLCRTSAILRFRKYTIMAKLIPNRIAIAIVYEAESGVKFVTIEPKRLIGRSSFCEKDTGVGA